MRVREVAYLYNPVFCGRILYSTIKAYGEKINEPFPFPLVYLVLPLILHAETRNSINSIQKIQKWIKEYPQVLIEYPQRARSLVPFTNEAVEFLLQTKLLQLTSNGELQISEDLKPLSENKFSDKEISDCLKKAKQIGRWFATAGKVETIYVRLGVRP
ncbi:three component ABC system middle component [uncultured Dubosiella sp.]|uniref:three component ABC system middle component n=1 Tax=uncultured Dubosiella sp. TaxID=1937011 RepID=UPI0025B57392|nr:three component ABC system middle component [uncultured Dubosiella sp.]